MDNRLIILYPRISEVMTERASRSQLMDSGPSEVPATKANPCRVKGKA